MNIIGDTEMLYAASAKSSHSREFNLELFAYLLLTLAINFYHLPYSVLHVSYIFEHSHASNALRACSSLA